MSTGETPPTPRFTSPSSNNNPPKKYPGTPKSPLTTNSTAGNNRNLLARQRLLSSKVSAPRPINLPSLRKEHAVGTEVLSSSPSTTSHGWGSSASSSPSNSFTQPSELESKVKSTTDLNTTSFSPTLDPAENPVKIDPKSNSNKSNITPTKADLASSPPPPPPPSQPSTTTRAWAIPAKTQATVQSTSTDFPTAAEAATNNKKKSSVYDDKEYLKYASSDPNHTSWDEMVSEDLDEEFSVDVVEFDDGTKVQIDGAAEESVNPSDRFTEDYDRSYPPSKTHHSGDIMDHGHGHHASSNYKPNYRRSEDHGYNNTRYNNSVHGYDNRRHSSSTTHDRYNNNHRRRESADSNGHNTNRRLSYDKKSSGTSSSSSHHGINNNSNNSNNTTSYHPTLLQRPRRLSEQSFRSDHSREDAYHLEHHTNPLQIIPEPSTSTVPPVVEEITAAQREVMLTAAERAKKRRDEEEAEFEAARIRARQKADALAEKARLEAAKKEKEKESVKEEKVEPTNATKPLEKKSSKDTTVKTVLKKKDSVSPEPTAAAVPTTPRTSSTIIDTSKPWNLVAANKKVTIEKRPKAEPPVVEKEKEPKEPEKEKEAPKPVVEKKEPPKFDKDGNPLTEDEQNWEMYVSRIKSDTTDKSAPKAETNSNAWASFATRLQQSVVDKQIAFEAKHKAAVAEKEKEIAAAAAAAAAASTTTVVEEIQYNEIEKTDTAASHHPNNYGKVQSRGWTRNDEEHGGHSFGERSGRGRGSSDRSTRGSRTAHGVNRRHLERLPYDVNEHEKEPAPVIKEILKHEPVTNTPSNVSKKSRLTNLLKESTSPIFPDAIQKLVGKKPANISFMIDMDESDKDITMMDVLVVEDVKEELKSEDVTSTKVEVMEDPVVESSSAAKSAEKPVESEPVESSVAPEESNELKPSETPSAPESVEVPSAVETLDETSATSSAASTPPRVPFQENQTKLGSSSPQRLNVNPNFPLLVYQYPVSQQQQQQQDQHVPVNGYSNGYSSRSKGYQQQQQQRPMGVYLMPPQQYMTSNQYLVSYPQGGAGVQPMYYPTMSWQSQQQYNSNGSNNSSPRPHYDQRRLNNSNHNTANHMSKWEAHTNSIAYQSHRPAYHHNNNANYRGGYRKQQRGGGFSSSHSSSRGRGGGYNNTRHSTVTTSRYPDVHTVPSSSPPSEEQPQQP